MAKFKAVLSTDWLTL